MRPMKLHEWFERAGKWFEGDQAPLRVLHPVYEAVGAFFFVPPVRTLHGPLVRDAVDIKRYMIAVVLALLPAYLFGLAAFGPRLIVMTVVSYAVGGLVESLFAIFRKEEINEGFLVTGLLFPMIVPPQTPLWIVAVGIAFGVFFGKEVFGGTGHNIFNPALVGRCFVALSWPAHLARSYIKPLGWIDAFTSRGLRALVDSPVQAVTAATPLNDLDTAVREGQALSFFSPQTAQLYLGWTAGSVCETAAWLILPAGLWLCWTRVSNWRTPAAVIGSYVAVGGVLSFLRPEQFVSPALGLAAGGLLFAAFYMATDPVTSPVSNRGKVIYGCGIGALVVIFRGLGAIPEGVTYAVLLMNMTAPLLDRYMILYSVPAALPRKEILREANT